MAIFFRLQEASWELWRWMGSDWGDRVWSLMGGTYKRGKDEGGVSEHLVVVVDSERERKIPNATTVTDVSRVFQRAGSCGPNRRYMRKSYTILMSRLMIMALLAIIVGVMALLTWYFTQMFFVDSVNTISLQLRGEMLRTSKGHFETLVHSSVLATQSIQAHMARRAGNMSAADAVTNISAPVSYNLFSLFPNLTVTGFMSEDGPFMVYGRKTATSNTQAWYSNETYGARTAPEFWTSTQVDDTGMPTGKGEPYYPTFNAEEMFKTETDKSDGPIWRMFSSTTTGTQIFSTLRCHPLKGVALAGISLETMSDFMANAMKQPLFHGGYMYFINEKGELISVSDSTDGNFTEATRTDLFSNDNFTTAVNSSNTRVAAGAKFLQAKVGLKGLLENEQHFSDIKILGQTFYVDSVPLTFMDLSVVVVILLPRHAVMHKVDQRSHMTMVIILAVAATVLVVGCAAVFLFTNRVSTEMELKAELILQLEAKRKAEASSNHKSQFMANMSHELRTPMAGIIGLVDILLSDDSLTSEQMDNVSQIRRCSMALLGLLNNILDLSKVEAGKLGLEKCDFDLGHEVASLVDMFSVQCLSSGVEIALDLSDDFPKMVRGDSARLRQIFANLVSNAIKFTPSGWICVKGWVETPPVVGKRGHAGKDPLSDTVMLHFEVEDTGCGIDPQKWESVFESFVQADASTTRTHGGTGLGLSIVRSLVHMMGGDIGIVPKRSGRGTLIKFFVVLEKVISDSPPGRPHEFPDELILEPVLGAQVVWGMAESLGRQIGARWMHARGFEVHEVGTWPEIVPTIRDLLQDTRSQSQELAMEMGRGMGVGGKYGYGGGSKVSGESGYAYAAGGEGEGLVLVILDIALLGCSNNMGMEHLDGPLAELQHLRDHPGIHVAWLLSPSTSKAVRRRLRDKGYTVVANKPVYQSKLLQLLLWLVGATDRSDDLSPAGALKAMVSQGGGIQVPMEDLYTSDLHRVEGSDGRAISLHSDDMSDSDCAPEDTIHSSPLRLNKNAKPMVVCPHDSSDDSPTSNITLLSSCSSSLNSHSQSNTPITAATNTPVTATSTSSFASSAVHRSILQSPQGSPMRDPHTPITAAKALASSRHSRVPSGTSFGHPAPEAWPLPPPAKAATAAAAAAAGGGGSRGDPTAALLQLARVAASGQRSPIAAAAVRKQQQQQQEEESLQTPEDVLGPGQYPLQFEDSQFLRTESAPTVPPPSTTPTTPNASDATPVADATGSGSGSGSGKAGITVPTTPPQSAKPAFGQTGRHRQFNTRPPNDALAGIHILVAEDTPVLRRLAVLMLQKLGATVTAVADGLEALVAVTNNTPTTTKIDLVLMDCQMPKMDGYQATQEIRTAEKLSGRHTPIVALTAHAMASDEERCLAVGMDGYLTKPIDSQLLVTTLLNLLTRLQQPTHPTNPSHVTAKPLS